jgi:hypothetical protein
MYEYKDTFHAPPDGRRYDFKSLKVRELNGRDDATIAKRSKGIENGVLLQMERVRACIVEVDGKPVPQPFEDFDTWNERSRMLALNAYAKLNGVDEKTVNAFLEGSGSSPTTDKASQT